MFSFFKKKPDIEFVDTLRNSYQTVPIMRAKDVKPTTFSVQKKKYEKHLFPHCPGMIDYAELGYIVPAWVDIHILANKAGVTCFIGSGKRGDGGHARPREMDARFIDGAFKTEDGITPTVLHIGSPWSVFCRKNITAMILPAFYHSTFLDDLHIIPGTVDYQKFAQMNLICMPKRACKIHIKVGEPLLHIIPFENKTISAGYGPGTQEQLDAYKNEIPGTTVKQYYRKNMATKKEYGLNQEA